MPKILVLLLGLISFHAFADQAVDAIYCDAPKIEGISAGHYARDQIAAAIEGSKDLGAPLPDFINWHNPVLASVLIQAGFPDLFNDLLNYSRGLLQVDRQAKNHLWEEASFGFPKLKLSPELRALCPGPQSEGLEVVRRVFRAGKAVYLFDPKAVDLLGPKGSLARSYLLLREWLENFSEDDKAIQMAVLEFHRVAAKPELARPDLDRVRLQVRALLGTAPRRSTCERSKILVFSLERALGKRCEHISARNLAALRDLKILDPQLFGDLIWTDEFEFRSGDFHGFDSLETLQMTKLIWLGTSLKSGIFLGLKSLKHLDLSASTIYNIWPELFLGIGTLESLTIEDAQVQHIASGSFAGLFAKNAKTRLSLAGSIYPSELRAGLFDGLEYLHELDLSGLKGDAAISEDFLTGMSSLRILEIGTEESRPSEVVDSVISASSLPKLERLKLKLFPYQAFSSVASLKVLESTLGPGFLEASLAERFENLEELSLLSHPQPLLRVPESFSRLEKLRVLRLWNAFNSVSSDESIKSIRSLPRSLQLFEYCHARSSEHEFGWFVQEFRAATFKGLTIRARHFCQGEWNEVSL